MTARTAPTAERADAPRPDAVYAFVAGLYVSLLLTPAVVFAISRVLAGAAALYVGFLVAVTAITALAGWVVSRVSGLAVVLGGTDAVWLLVALPFGWVGGMFGATVVGADPPGLLVLLATFGTGGGAFSALALVAMSRNRHAAAALGETTELATWEARWPERWRRVAGVVVVVAFGLGTLGGIAAFVFDREWAWPLYYLVFVGTPVMNLLNSRTFRATDAGLVVGNPVQRQFRPWSTFAGYERTGDALVIRPTAWWRPAHRCDLADVEDVEAVVSTLERAFTHPGSSDG